MKSKWITLAKRKSKYPWSTLRKRIRELNVFCYEYNLFQCSGRLRNAPITSVRKTPILLNTNHRLTELIVFNIEKMF